MAINTTGTSHPRCSSKQKQQYLVEFVRSGISAKEFCTLNNISEDCFRKWQQRYKDSNTQPESSGFTELKVSERSNEGKQRMLFAQITTLKIYQPVSAAYLKDIL